MGHWKYQTTCTSKSRARRKDTLAQTSIVKYSRHRMQNDMLSAEADLQCSTEFDVGVAYRQVSLVVILTMQAALSIGAIRVHNDVLQVLN
jgi:hypothetical protein